MSSRFTAVPLANGESFVLETDVDGMRKVVLVDGGQSKVDDANRNELYQAIMKHCPGIDGRIDIAICTHRDNDHAGGFPAFVKAWLSRGNEIGEFWLPGAWSGAVEHLLVNPDRIVSLLVDGARIAAQRTPDTRVELTRNLASTDSAPTALRSIDALMSELRRSPESDADRAARVDRMRAPSLRPLGYGQLADDGRPEDRMVRAATSWGFSVKEWRQIGESLESSNIHDTPLSGRMGGLAVWLWCAAGIELAPLARTLAANAIDTAEAIRAIASAAVSFDIPVRWFDFEMFEDGNTPAGGYPGFLVPLNTVEVEASPREDEALKLFLKLTLTEQNVASLVFQRIETEEEPGVVFVADSRLAFGIDRPETDFPKHLEDVTRPIIYTAAHHGSRNNDHAYKVLAEWLAKLYPVSIAVRNGGVWNQTLDGFLEVEQRRCAQCYQCHGGDWSQLVQINSGSGNWVWPSDQGRGCGTPRSKEHKLKP